MALLLALVMVLSVLLTGCSQKAATPAKEEYPTKPLTNIVAWAAGGSSDLSQRAAANVIAKYFGQSMVVVNKPGGATIPGTTEIARAKPDGYTIGVGFYASFVLRPNVLDVSYKIDDFTYIIGMVRQRNCIAVRADSPFKTLPELVEYAKKNPNKLKFSAGTTASWQHVIGIDFNQKAGIETQFVPYDGGRPASVALLGGHVDFLVGQTLEFAAELKAGQFRVLAMFEKERSRELPNVPTAIELGYQVYHPQMMVIVGPKGMPADRVKKIHDAYQKVLQDPEFKKMVNDIGMEIEYMPGEQAKKEILELDPIYKKLLPQITKK
jgi:tripartite-type tricarboxylate transporter receptor subunit TctC